MAEVHVMRRPTLTEKQQRELLRRYYLYRENQPWKIAQDFGIGKSTLKRYVNKLRRVTA